MASTYVSRVLREDLKKQQVLKESAIAEKAKATTALAAATTKLNNITDRIFVLQAAINEIED
jgi:hypothetical protein